MVKRDCATVDGLKESRYVPPIRYLTKHKDLEIPVISQVIYRYWVLLILKARKFLFLDLNRWL